MKMIENVCYFNFSSSKSYASGSKKRNDLLDEAILKLIDKQSTPDEEDDPLKLFFLTMYSTVKKFPKTFQVGIKKKIQADVFEIEHQLALLDNDL